MANHIVPVSTEIDRFNEHLSLRDNIRILFSAPFGAGKSSFIQTFFDKNKDYIVIKIFPTSYSVASNKDIFELIKFDILSSIFEDFSEYIELGKEEFNDFLVGQMFALHQMDLYSLSQTMIKAFIPKAKPGLELADQLKGLFEKFADYKKDIKKTEEDSIIDYLVSLRMQVGSINEHDFFTQKINEYLKTIKEKSKRQIVLVIDDLDRLDADHVFRIFNIFTAHYDSKTEQNKFGFDKLILVCDVSTLEHLFYHRYGPQADFDGYIDKFYSQYIFYFNNKKHLTESINKLLVSKNDLAKNYPDKTCEGNYLHYYGFERSRFFEVFQYILEQMIKNDLIKVRGFMRFQEYSLPHVDLYSKYKSLFSSDDYTFLVLMHLLCQFFPRSADLENALSVLYQRYPSDYETSDGESNYNEGLDNLIISFSLPFLIGNRIRKSDPSLQSVILMNENQVEVQMVFRINAPTNDDGIEYMKCSKVINKNGEREITGAKVNTANAFWFLYCAYQECKKREYKLKLFEF